MKKALQRIGGIFVVAVMFSLLFCQPVKAASDFKVNAEVGEDRTVTLSVTVNNRQAPITGFDIYCAEEGQTQYQYLGECERSYPYREPDATTEVTTENPVSTTEAWMLSDPYDMEDDKDYGDEPETISFRDTIKHSPYRHCNYQIQAYQMQNGVKVVTQQQEISVMIDKEAPKISYHKRKGKLSAKIKWNKESEADGYFIYCFKDNGQLYDNTYYNNLYKESKYKLVKTIKSNAVNTATFSHLKHGITYAYRVYSYKNVNGRKVKSLSSDPETVIMDYYTCANESYDSKFKRAFGSEKAQAKNFKKESRARKQMKTIKIKVWDFKNGKNGKKVTKIKYLTVNKNLAPSIQKMFQEIYKSKQKQVIHDIGCYSYRQGEHMYGLAIDINPNENYMIDGKKKKVGNCWKPKTNPYSIPLKCDFVRIMEKYGFYRGLWGYRKDYMHFSYFGG